MKAADRNIRSAKISIADRNSLKASALAGKDGKLIDHG